MTARKHGFASRPTARDIEILTFMCGFFAEHGYSPTWHTILHALGLSPRSIYAMNVHMRRLEALGYIRMEGRGSGLRTAILRRPDGRSVRAELVLLSPEDCSRF